MREVLGLLLLLAPAAGPAWSGPRVEVEHPHGIAQLRIDGEPHPATWPTVRVPESPLDTAGSRCRANDTACQACATAIGAACLGLSGEACAACALRSKANASDPHAAALAGSNVVRGETRTVTGEPPADILREVTLSAR